VFEVLVSNPDIVKKMFVVIMLDFSQVLALSQFSLGTL
jgi:hypothetical protein